MKTPPLCNVRPGWVLEWGESAEPTIQGAEAADVCASPGGRFVVVGDLWLAQRDALHRKLGVGAGLSDAALVAGLWERSGPAALGALVGMFGFCLWDRERRELWLVRDRAGGRTLYYVRTALGVWVAPRLASLRSFHGGEVDPVALCDYLCCAFVPGERTLWQQAREVRPGVALHLPKGETVVYWQPCEAIEEAGRPLEWHAERVRALLEEVLSESLPTAEPVGAYLSGGLDSSAIVALARRLHDRPVHTFSIHFGPDCPNELEFSDLVARHTGSEHHVLAIKADDLWNRLGEAMAYLDDPIGDPLTVPNLMLGEMAREWVGVILNGEGGDPCFGGPKNQPMLLSALYSPLVPATDLVGSYLASFQKCAADLPQLVRPEILSVAQRENSVFAADLSSEASYLNRLMVLNIKFKGADLILTKVNNLTRAAGVEGRSPLFDERVVQLSLTIPPAYKVAGAVEKAVLKRAVADLLPEAIIKRPKSGMMVPVQQYFRERWTRQARALLLDRHALIAPLLQQPLIRDWLAYRGELWPRHGIKLWLLASLEVWLQVHHRPQRRESRFVSLSVLLKKDR